MRRHQPISKLQQNNRFDAFTQLIGNDDKLGKQLRETLLDPAKLRNPSSLFNAKLSEHVTPANKDRWKSVEDVRRAYFNWFWAQDYDHPTLAAQAIAEFKKISKEKSNRRGDEARNLGFPSHSPATRKRKEVINGGAYTRILTRDQLSQPAYPEKGVWIWEEEEIRSKWQDWVDKRKQPDIRLKRKGFMKEKMDPSKLSADVAPHESAVIKDDSGNMQMIILRDFCPSPERLRLVDKIVNEYCEVTRNIRMEDAGILSLAGWSAGSRSSPQFDWAKNIVKKMAEGDEKNLLYEGSSAFAIFWNMLRSILENQEGEEGIGQEVVDDFTSFMQSTGLPTMDAGRKYGEEESTIKLQTADGDTIIFYDAELAPPAGVFARNYARSTHTESQPHKFAASWTTGRTKGAAAGGHFYNCSLRVRVQGAENTLIIWKPEHVHGTSLQDLDPSDPNPEFQQTGLAIVTSNRLPNVYKEYRRAAISREEAEKLIYTSTQHYGEEDGSDAE